MKTNKNIPPSGDLHLSNEMINVKGNRSIAGSTDLNQPDGNINSTDLPNFTKLTSNSRAKHNQSKLGVSKLNLESIIESPVMVKNQQADCVKDPFVCLFVCCLFVIDVRQVLISNRQNLIGGIIQNQNVSIQGIIMKHLGGKSLVDKGDNNHDKKMQCYSINRF